MSNRLRTTVTKRFRLDSAHFLPDYPGKCQRMHGHSWEILITIGGPVNPETGMIVDFSAIKERLVKPLENKLDHQILNQQSLGLFELEIPTAENIALAIYEWCSGEISGEPFRVVNVRVFESTDSYATVIWEQDGDATTLDGAVG